MKQEDKALLLKDLCGRLPYGVKVKTNNINVLKLGTHTRIGEYITDVIEPCKPYLFPLSSMTEAQKKEYEDSLTYHCYIEGGWVIAKSFNDEYIVPYWFVDFCNKNHLDYRGLIEKDLAINATDLNIY